MADPTDFWLMILSQNWKENTQAFLLRNVGPVQTGVNPFKEALLISGEEAMQGKLISRRVVFGGYSISA